MVKVFYDGQCYVCDTEVQHYKKYQSSETLQWIDITDQNFNALAYGLKSDDVMHSLHTIDKDGHVRKGIDSFVVIWEQLPKPYPIFAKIIQLPIVYTSAKIFYACFAKVRGYLPKKKTTCELKPKTDNNWRQK